MSQLNFDPEVGLLAPETYEIREKVANDWKSAFAREGMPPLNTEHATPAGQVIDAQTAEIEAKNSEILYLANQFNPSVAEGRWQDALGQIYFLTRKMAEPTVVTCQLTGLRGTAVPYGAIVRTSEGQTLICNRSVTIGTDGSAETTFRCSETGAIEVAAGSVTSIVTTVPGWDTITNKSAGATGRDLETRSEFEARRAASVAANAHGSVSAIYGAIANLDGVLDVQVLENISPLKTTKFGVELEPHSIAVCVFGGDDGNIAEAIYRKKDAGCATSGNTQITYTAADYSNAEYIYRIVRPAPLTFTVRVTLKDTETLTDLVKDSIKKSIYADFYGNNTTTGNARVGLASTVYASRFYKAVMAVEGVQNLVSITIALGNNPASGAFTDVVLINGNQEPVMSLDNVTITVQG